jgi:hypothetical protein
VRIPDQANPLETRMRYAAEVFIVETRRGPAVVWLDPFWCEHPSRGKCHIAYAKPNGNGGPGRWVDNDPRYGPGCLVCQKPFVMEHLEHESSAWADYKAWQIWREGKSQDCGRKAAWALTTEAFGDLILERII